MENLITISKTDAIILRVDTNKWTAKGTAEWLDLMKAQIKNPIAVIPMDFEIIIVK